LYFAIRNTVFYGPGEEGELSNTVFFSEKYRYTLIYFSAYFGIDGRSMPQPMFIQANSFGRRWED